MCCVSDVRCVYYVVSQLRCGSAGAAWCSSAAAGGPDPSRTASSWPWQEPLPSFLSPPHPRPHPHLSRRRSCPRLPPPAGTPAETVGIKHCVQDKQTKTEICLA